MSKLSVLPFVLKRHWLPALAAFGSVIGSALVYAALTPPVYKASGRLLLNEQLTGVSALSEDLTQLSGSRETGANPLVTQAELMKSQRVLEQAIYLYESQVANPKPLTTGKLRSNLDVKILPATNILEASFQDDNPELAAQLLNAVLQATAEENAESIRIEASAVREFLESEVPAQEARLEQAETAENRYREASGLIDLGGQKQALIEQLSDIDLEENTIVFQLRTVNAELDSLAGITGVTDLDSAYAAVRVGQDVELDILRKTLIDLEAQVIDARSRLGELNPDLIALIERRDEMRRLYQEELGRVLPKADSVPENALALDQLSQGVTSDYITAEIERQSLEERLDAVRRTRAEVQNILTQLPRSEQTLLTLARRREEAAATLRQLQTQLDEARIAEAQLVSNIRILDTASTPTSSIWPKLSVILTMATAAGLALAILVIILREALNQTFDDAIEVEDLVQLPVLGLLPELPATALLLEQPDRFLNDPNLVEPYRTLLKVLDSKVSKSPKLIAVTSSVPEDGKSTIAAHLAAVAGLLSYRTLLIDANLSQPSQESIFHLPSNAGLTHVIQDGCSLLEAAQPTNINMLSLLSHGEMTTRPASIIEAAAMKSLLEEAKQYYDLVIVDSPSLMNSADAVTLGNYSDGLLIVARPNYTPKEHLRRTVSGLLGSGMPVLGVAINESKNLTRVWPLNSHAWHKPAHRTEQLLSREHKQDSVNVR